MWVQVYGGVWVQVYGGVRACGRKCMVVCTGVGAAVWWCVGVYKLWWCASVGTMMCL